MERNTVLDVLIGAYVAALCLYVGWRLGRSLMLRDQETSRLRSELWELQARLAHTAEKSVEAAA
jgi:Arc/MetJ family transcription regulator